MANVKLFSLKDEFIQYRALNRNLGVTVIKLRISGWDVVLRASIPKAES